MTSRSYLARRVTWTVLIAYLVLSGTFLVFAFTPDPNQRLAGMAGAGEARASGGNATAAAQEAMETYAAARNRDRPLLQRYAGWMLGYVTLDWGYAYSRDAPVTAVLARHVPVTLVYLVPAVALSLVAGVAIGLAAALRQHSGFDRLATTGASVLIGVPSFLAAVFVLLVVRWQEWGPLAYALELSPLAPANLAALAGPMLVLTVSLTAVQIRYARSETLEYVPAEFVKTLRANGAGVRSIATHVLRNAAVPLVSVFFTEMLTVLFVSVYVVEIVFSVPGFGAVAYEAILRRDIGLVLGTTMLPMFVALVGNLVQDVSYAVLDPRVEAGDR